MNFKKLFLAAILLTGIQPNTTLAFTQKDVQCLAENMYFESRNESSKGMLAVSLVVMNRVKAHHYPNKVCDVVRQGPMRESWKTRQDPDLPKFQRVFYPVKHRCQFSWYCDGKADTVYNKEKWEYIYNLAHAFLFKYTYGHFDDFTKGAIYYHADYVNPYWANEKEQVVQIGAHIFYKENPKIVVANR